MPIGVTLTIEGWAARNGKPFANANSVTDARREAADGRHVQQRGQGTTVIDPFTHTIDGRGATSPASFDVLNPRRARSAAVPGRTRAQSTKPSRRARAFAPWSRLSFEERRLSLFQFAAAMRGQVEDLAQLLVREQGKTLAECRKELSFVPLQIERLSSIDVAGEILRDDAEGRIELRYRPLGVVGIITPWNVPVGIAIGRIVQALYTGNTVVQKPSPIRRWRRSAWARRSARCCPQGS